jgi:hypothetical protein
MNSRWFLVAKSGLLVLFVWLVQQEATAEAQKAAGQAVTALDLPDSLAYIVAIVYGALQSGQKK